MVNFAERAAVSLGRIRSITPLVHNITNFVVMNYTANVLLASGASPVMAHAENEVEEMAELAGSLVLNIGTLSDLWVDAMVKAGKTAGAIGIPIILDPVGVGATTLRTTAAKRILHETRVKVLRGNSSEILALAGQKSMSRGVDAGDAVDEAAAAASQLAKEYNTTVAVTGPVDCVTDGIYVVEVANGHALMPYVTGTGCAVSALVGAFAAVEEDMVVAAAGALAFLGLAGEQAAKKAKGPGTFMIELLDALYNMSPEELNAGALIRKR